MSLIKLASEYGDPRRQASEMPHGMTARQTEELAARFDSFLPGLASPNGLPARSDLQAALPKGANLMRTAQGSPWGNGGGNGIPGNMSGGNGKTFFTQQRPYQPEFESPDRQQYPVHRILANRYWRLFYKLDPIIGNCIDMYGDMPWSQFKLTGPGVEGSVLKTMEAMCEESDLLGVLPAMVREFFVVGEVCPHLFFDDDKGYWTHIALHNPDQLEVIDAPFIKMDPIVQFIPDDRLRSVLTSNNPLLRGIREKMPPQLLAQLQARQNIPLSSVNATFIPRKLHYYDTRGTSILSRLWRILMYEDAIFNASIQTARRHAGPIKIAKLGNPQTGWIPGPEHEAKLLQLLAQAEMDPHAWLVYHYGIEFDTVGTTDRMMSIKAEWETIERIKLIALGISKCFIAGTKVYMADGSHTSIEDVKVGDSVIDKDGKTAVVTDAWCEGVPDELTTVTTLGHHQITSTPNHYHQVMRGGELVKVQAQDIVVGDYLTIPRQFEEREPDGVTLGQARLLGYLISDGYVVKGPALGGRSHGNGFSFTFGAHEQHLVNDVVSICQELGINVGVWPQETRHSINVGTQHKDALPLAKWLLAHGGSYAHTKKLSADVMAWPLQYKIELLKGLFRGDGNITVASSGKIRSDGTYRKQLRVRYTTASETLSRQMQLIIAQLGIHAAIKLTDLRKHGVTKRLQYNLHITGPNAYKMLHMVWDGTDKENISIAEPIGSENKYKVTDMFLLLPVIRVTPTCKNIDNIPVYNLTVSGTHSYVVECMSTYNSFLHGEVTYASAATGLQVFLQRLKALRMYFEQKWLLPKFFQTMAEINGWIRRSPAEINHRFRIKRSQKELIEENRYIRPKIVWEKSLDPAVDANLINAMQVLESMGVKFSKTTKMATVGMSFEEESHKIQQEQQFERQFLPKLPSDQQPQDEQPPGGGMMSPAPDGGPPAPPPEGDDSGAPPGAPPPPPPGADQAPTPPPAALHAEGADGEKKPKDPPRMKVEKVEVHKPGRSSNPLLSSEIWKDDRFGNWHADEVGELVELFTQGTTGSPMWARLLEQPAFAHAMQSGNGDAIWDAVHDLLDAENFPEQDVKELRQVLVHEGFLPALEDLENTIELQPEVESDDGFLVGTNARDASRKLSGDISGKLIEARERMFAAKSKQANKIVPKRIAPPKKKPRSR